MTVMVVRLAESIKRRKVFEDGTRQRFGWRHSHHMAVSDDGGKSELAVRERRFDLP